MVLSSSRFVGSSVVEDGKVQLAQVGRIENAGYRRDLASLDLEIEDSEQPPIGDHNDSHRAVHKHSLTGPESVSTFRNQFCHKCRSLQLRWHALRQSPGIESDHHIGIEHSEERLEGPSACGSKKGFNHFSLSGEIGILYLSSSPHPAAGTAGKLSGCCL